MRRALIPALVLICLATLVAVFFGDVLVADHQFGFRDIAYFYYPLYQRVQHEWEAGRIPLWEMEENAGMPLLGNPAAAVFYPGKLVYGLLSYAWAARLYVVGHVLLAFAGQWSLLRSWGAGPAGAAMGGLAYTFGGPVVFQYSNIIFLVGAAWAPWGFRAADRLLRLGRRWAIWELALVLAMETLGGDPQTAYLTVVSAGGYAVGMSLCGGAGWRGWSSPALWRIFIGAGIVAILWGMAVMVTAHLMLGNRPGLAPATPPARLPIEALSLAAWGMGGMAVVWHWWRRRAMPAVGRCLLALFGSAALAAGLSATQLLPAIEFVSHSLRAIPDGPHAVYPFSVEPWRAVEWVWPNIFGPMLDTRQNLLELIPPRHVVLPWVPSLYLGCATLVLSLVGAGFRGVPPWRAWMTALALISFVASIGEYASPLWWGRSAPGWQSFLGNHDPPGVTRELRGDGTLLDGDGSPYWLLTMVLPGFGAFRYPGKLLTLTSLSLSALAGMGWDKLLARRSVRVERWSLGVLALTLVLLIATTLGRDRLVARFGAHASDLATKGAPGQRAAAAVSNLQASLLHGAAAWAMLLALVHCAWRRPRLAGPLMMVLLTLDLAVANRTLIVTLPQAAFDQKPRLLELIEKAERKEPAPGPFRVHRPTGWSPARLTPAVRSPDAERLSFDWSWSTLTPKAGLSYGLEYTFTTGTAELADYSWFFFPITTKVDAALAGSLKVEPNRPIVYYPRRGFDLWNTRYFILPTSLRWDNPVRGFASLLVHTRQIAPDPTEFSGPEGKNRRDDWSRREDWVLLRNEQSFPRAWVVHRAHRLDAGDGQRTIERRERIQPVIYTGDPFWNLPGRPVDDPHEMAWLEADDFRNLRRFIAGDRPTPGETVSVHYPSPQRVEIEARLEKPGLVILADVFYPGWKLQIDGREATLVRVNGMMRGAAVEAGFHRLVQTYEPASFRAGLAITGVTLALALAVGIWAWRNPAGVGMGRALVAKPS